MGEMEVIQSEKPVLLSTPQQQKSQKHNAERPSYPSFSLKAQGARCEPSCSDSGNSRLVDSWSYGAGVLDYGWVGEVWSEEGGA